MTLESTLQRVNELRSPTAPATSASPAASARAGGGGAGSPFAAELALAQAQQQVSAAGANGGIPLPTGWATGQTLYPASAYPVVTAYGAAPAWPSSVMPASYSTPGTYGPGGLAPTLGVGYPQPGVGGAGARIVQLAQGELGVREQPAGSNDGPRIRQYRSAAGATNTPGPWCAYFVSWLAQSAGAPIGSDGKGTGWVPDIEQWGRSSGRWNEASGAAQPGDIIIFDRNGDGLSDHTGIVERVGADGTVHTIEGNTGGENVARRSYGPGEGQVRGFVRPG